MDIWDIQRQRGTPYTIIPHGERASRGHPSRPHFWSKRSTPALLPTLYPPTTHCTPITYPWAMRSYPKGPRRRTDSPTACSFTYPARAFCGAKVPYPGTQPPHKFPLLARSNVPTSENRGQSRVRDAGEVLYRRNNRPFPTIRPRAASVSGNVCPWWKHFGLLSLKSSNRMTGVRDDFNASYEPMRVARPLPHITTAHSKRLWPARGA